LESTKHTGIGIHESLQSELRAITAWCVAPRERIERNRRMTFANEDPRGLNIDSALHANASPRHREWLYTANRAPFSNLSFALIHVIVDLSSAPERSKQTVERDIGTLACNESVRHYQMRSLSENRLSSFHPRRVWCGIRQREFVFAWAVWVGFRLPARTVP
jgi:hypothetical protein